MRVNSLVIHGAPHIKAASVTPDQAVVILMVLQMPIVKLQIPAVITPTDLLIHHYL